MAYPSTHPGYLFSSSRRRLTADTSAIGVVYLHRLGLKTTATANGSDHFAA
eukprot:CAMPEP_0172324512 /NCGR_PEP_ID=MMETSP1058-20130122/51550_1 /TAXON_ID=83371 /ORGANISM="Detonula confervacea, Strain CCMP 353" /LENGTH=50 /DNA_ID=CAMNT_0013040801 /DNA_START=7 /DNA_END=159 /DNA_ORIENTATION=+